MTVRRLDTERKSNKAVTLAQKFKDRIVGQPKATDALVTILEKYQSGFYDRKKPIGSLLFLGPTGTGKTGTVEAFVEGLFGNPQSFMKIDCGEFQHSHEIAKLTGSPPGYLGHRETHPFFTNQAVKSYQIGDLPLTVILFDEIEKASDALWNLLLGILDKGNLTTGTNEVVDFTQTIILMTSNVGSAEMSTASGDGGLGFVAQSSDIATSTLEDIAMGAARRKFMPEFLNRLDGVVMFNTLTQGDIEKIMRLELQKLQDRIVLQCSRATFDFQVSPAAYDEILKQGYDKRYNARNIKRTIERLVAEPLGRLVATGQIGNNDTLIVDYLDGKWNYFAETQTLTPLAKAAVSAGQLALSKM